MAKKSKVGLDNLAGFFSIGAHADCKYKISTGYFNLDFAINFGTMPGDMVELGSSHKVYDPTKPLGIPGGRIVEIFGPEGGGKSSISYRIAGQAQKMGKDVAWIDTEQSFSEDLAIINGVDLDKLIYSDVRNLDDPDEIFCAEDIMDNIVSVIKNDIAQVVILDSVANLIPKTVMENPAEKQTVAELARLMGRTMGKVTQWAGAKDALVIFINQIRDKPGVMFGPSETTPGGRALKHLASLRLRITKRLGKDSCIFIEDPDNPGEQRLIGRNSYVQIEKNRFAKPLLNSKGGGVSVDVPIYYEPYFPNIEDIIFDAGRQHQIIRVRKGEFKWTDEDEKHAVEGRREFIEYIQENNLLENLAKAVKEKSDETGVPLPPELTQYLDGLKKASPKKSVGKIAKKKRGRPPKKDDHSDGADGMMMVDDDDIVNVDDVEPEELINENETSRDGEGENT